MFNMPKPITQQELQQAVDKQKPEVKPIQPMRQILIETDGQQIKVVKNECSALETMSIFSILLNKINQK